MKLRALLSFILPVFGVAPGGAAASLGGAPGAAAPAGGTGELPLDGGAAANDYKWLGEGVAPEISGYVKNKGWINPLQVIEGYQNLEKLRGVPAERLLTLPGDDKPESWAPIFDKLGRPKAPGDYKLPVPTGDDGKFAAVASDTFHKLGLNTKQAHGLAAWWTEQQGAMVKAQGEAHAIKAHAELGEVKTLWGGAYDEKMDAVDRAARTFGMDETRVKQLDVAWGRKATLEFMARIGEALGEHRGAGVDTLKQPGLGALQPDQAIAEIAALRADAEWVKKYFAGDKDARARIEQLHKWAYPETSGAVGA